MSSSPPAPEDASSSSALNQSDVGQTNVAGGKSDKKAQSPRPPPRSKSASLLTQALATNYEAEEDAAVSLRSSDVPFPSTTTTALNRAEDSAAHIPQNDLNIGARSDSGSHEMAVVESLPNVDLRNPAQQYKFLSDSAQDVSSTTTYSFFSLPGDSVMTSNGRGTSLERTNQEKKVVSPLQGPVTSNLGDTGLSGNVTPQSPVTPDISSNPPTEGMRARYRSWRDARPVAAERTWSIGQQSSEESGQVENSIKDAIAGIGPSSRSRKASHSMRFFKEGLPEDKTKRKESKTRLHTRDESSQGRTDGGNEGGISREEMPGKLRNHTEKKSPFPSPRNSDAHAKETSEMFLEHGVHKSQAGYFDIATGPADATEDQLRTFPAQLLEDIRKNHNLTPGAHKGMSFSQSLPVTESEKPLPDVPLRMSPESDTKTTTQALDEDSEAQQSKTDEEDDSGTEHIFSAVFLPHQKAHKESDEDEDEDEDQSTDAFSRQSLQRPEKPDKQNSQQWLEEHEVSLRSVDEKIVHNQPITKPLPSPRFSKSPNPYGEKDTRYSSDTHDWSKEEDFNYGHGFSDKNESTSRDDQESDTTPTGSLLRQATIAPSQVQEPQNEEKQPLDAIELIPYRHQVGGHTTMWRFSKRAVCKELNNRENEFYENVERLHPKLCKFLPRYIGVLNVSFSEKPRRKVTKKDEIEEKEGEDKRSDPQTMVSSPASTNGTASVPAQSSQNRVISQSLHSSSVPIPTVTFAANRHIIPKSLLRPLGPFGDPHHRSKSDSEAPIPKALQHETTSSPADQSVTDGDYPNEETKPVLPKSRPKLEDKHSDSWGYTIKNKDLRNKVFDEVFLGHPVPIQHQRKGTTHRRSLPHRNPAVLRPSNSESNLNLSPAGSDTTTSQPAEESMRMRALKTAAGMRQSSLASMTSPESLEDVRLLESGIVDIASLDDKSGTSAPEYDSKSCDEPHVAKHKRRYSSGGLRRKPTEVAESRGNLKYFEEADDAGYKGDGEEDEVFAMEIEPRNNGTSTTEGDLKSTSDLTKAGMKDLSHPTTPVGELTMLPATPNHSASMPPDLDIPRPVNPKEAQAQQDARVVYFLLLEDLTAGMKRPCIMDLKMGTRQYGVDANEKKQKSQRQKCEATTSRELGVRVCGLQVWDVRTQTYIFQDKYYGRDLKAGTEFKGALERFLYDGVDYASVLRRIPTILKKLADLELLVATLKGYRFYAASLLMFYDGDITEEGESDSTATEKELGGKKKKEIDFKIADFANCVIREDDITGRSCPPRHPDEPDRGFLRGLRSLRMYFRAIEKDLQRRELGRFKDDLLGLDGGMDDVNGYDDEGEVSY